MQPQSGLPLLAEQVPKVWQTIFDLGNFDACLQKAEAQIQRPPQKAASSTARIQRHSGFCLLLPASAPSPACLEGLHDIRALFCKGPCLKIPIYRTECWSCSFGMLLHHSIKALQSRCRFLHGLLHVLMVWQGFFGLQVYCNPVACPTAQEKYDYTCKLDIDAYCLTCCKVYPHVT